MAFRKSLYRKSRTAQDRSPRLPHPSWRVIATASADGVGTARIASATDFWDRLGL